MLIYAMRLNTLLKILFVAALFGIYVFFNYMPGNRKIKQKNLLALNGGYELILVSTICILSEFALYFSILFNGGASGGANGGAIGGAIGGANNGAVEFSPLILVINAVVSLILIAPMYINGFIRIFSNSTQLGAKLRLYIIFLWWFPIVNFFLFYKCCQCARLEYDFELKKDFRNAKRAEQLVCKTKYPILMVHGIFFRDWKLYGYWGRIPDELTKNGAAVYFGDQQSSSPVELSANEIKRRIMEVIRDTGCEKVNIIAHSKGGLDSRYAISCLDMGQYVASLTTINTPHKGCEFAGKLINMTPDKLIASIGKKYEALFTKLGDSTPDFFGGVSELTVEKCAELNKEMPDCEGVLYQSAGSKMASANASPFPLSVGYRIIAPLEGDNDGLVATKSMAWGDFLGIVDPPEKLGVSHGDMIDLTRKNIYGFDVAEFYVKLVSGLKEKGL